MLQCFLTTLRATSWILPLYLFGCAVQGTQVPSSRFQENLDASGALIGSYLIEISDFNRRIYLDEVLDATKKPTAQPTTRMANAATPLLNPNLLLNGALNSKAVQIRTQAVAVLAIYARRMAEKSGIDLHSMSLRFKVNTPITEIGVSNLQTREEVQKYLSLSETELISQFEQPVDELTAILINDSGTKVALESNAALAVVHRILSLLEADMRRISEGLQTTRGFSATGSFDAVASIIGRVNQYNDPNSNMNSLQRQRALGDLDRMIQRQERLSAVNPVEIVTGMRDVIDSLFRFAVSNHKDDDVQSVLSITDQLDSRVKRNEAIVAQLRSLRLASAQ